MKWKNLIRIRIFQVLSNINLILISIDYFFGLAYAMKLVHISIRFQWNLYFYVSDQSRPFWAVLNCFKIQIWNLNRLTHKCNSMGQGISLKSERNSPWFNILLHPQSIVDATVQDQSLQYLGYITLYLLWVSSE